jgi:hypothetical protein
VSGTGFTGATAVSFGGTASGYFYRYSDTALPRMLPVSLTIRFTTPKQREGNATESVLF